MKKLLTLCLALALTVAVGTAALLTTDKPSAKAADDSSVNLVFSASDASGVFTDDITALTPLTSSGAIAQWSSVLGMSKFTNVMQNDAKLFVKFDTPINVSTYSYLNFKAMYWAEGGYGKYGSTDIYSSENVDTGYNADIFASWSDATCAVYMPNSLWVSIPTAKIKKADGTIDGFIIKNSIGAGWFMLSDFNLSDVCYTRVDVNNSNAVSDGTTYKAILQGGPVGNTPPLFASQSWKDEELCYRISMGRKAFTSTVKFTSPVDGSTVDYFYFKALCWEDRKPYAPVILKNLDGTEVKTLDVYYDWNANGEIGLYLPADALKNTDGDIEGFILDAANGATNLVFSDIIACKGTPDVMIDVLASSSTSGSFGRDAINGIAVTTSEGLLYNGKGLGSGTISTVFKLPVSSSVHKTIEFKALAWHADGVKKVQISRLDGTKTEIVNVVSGYYSDVSDKDITVKVNAELLADENGEVAGFKMNIIDGSCDHFVFSAMNGLATEKEYSVIYKADGANDIIKTFTKSTKSDFETPAVPTKEHYTGVWENHDIIYADDQVVNAVYTPITYTATFRADGADDQIVNYTIENKDTITVPTVPAREHYTGEWNEFTLNFDNEQVITAKYTATRYTVTFKADGETVATETYTVENKTVNEPAVPAKKGYDGAWSKYELNFENIEVTAEYTFGKAAGFSVSLAGDIGLNFYATLSADTDEMTAQVTFKGETVTVKGVKTDKVAGNAFVFRFPVAPKDYKENVAFVVTTLGGDTITATSSVKEYADKFAEGEDGYALVQKMLAYCEAARVYFAAETVDTAKDFTADLTAFAATVSGTDDDITVEGATLVLEDTTEIKLYFTCADLTGKTFKVGNSEVTPEAVTGVENCYVLRLKNIVMKDIDELYDFTLGGKTVRYGALSYVKATLEDKDTSVSLGNLVKALYELNVAANAYFAA